LTYGTFDNKNEIIYEYTSRDTTDTIQVFDVQFEVRNRVDPELFAEIRYDQVIITFMDIDGSLKRTVVDHDQYGRIELIEINAAPDPYCAYYLKIEDTIKNYHHFRISLDFPYREYFENDTARMIISDIQETYIEMKIYATEEELESQREFNELIGQKTDYYAPYRFYKVKDE